MAGAKKKGTKGSGKTVSQYVASLEPGRCKVFSEPCDLTSKKLLREIGREVQGKGT